MKTYSVGCLPFLGADPLGCKPRPTDLRPWLWGAALAGSSEHSPREIAAGGAFKVMTEEIISQGHPRAHARGVLWYGVNPSSAIVCRIL